MSDQPTAPAISAIDVLAKTWTSPDAARMWVKRHPDAVGDMKVVFDAKNAVFVLRPETDDADQTADLEPDFAQEPVVTKKPAKAAKAAKAPVVKAAKPAKAAPVKAVKAEAVKPVIPAVADPTGGVMIRDAALVIAGLPETSTAYTWALELARKLGKPIEIHVKGEVVATIDAAWLAKVKASKTAARTPKAAGPRAEKTAPEGKRLEVVELCMREQGASTKELIALTTWKGCPWSWTIGNNKNGTGLADRYGYGFSKQTVDGEVRYFLTPAPAQAAAA
jgi:hypothetical protein